MNLMKLVTENPDLPIIPMVNSEVVDDSCCEYWEGSWGKADIVYYAKTNDNIWFSTDRIEDIFEAEFDDPQEFSRDIMKEKVYTLNWKRAIVVYIELPEN